jgi:pimeloyl-ACP methyl ester carboxylesterase
VPNVTTGQVHGIGLNSYQLYVPDTHSSGSRVLVVVHGETRPDQDVAALAETFINRWTGFAEQTGAVIVAPAFSQLDFGSDGDGRGGYRGLYGRVMGADEFLHNVLTHVGHVTSVPTAGRRFFLYGHSAGGQFANRYLVRHPDRVIAAVLSAPGRYAFPDEGAPWHFGMDALRGNVRWDLAGETHPIDHRPDPDGWVDAATLPISVIVGDRDDEKLRCLPAQCDPAWGDEATRIDIGRRWVEQMNRLAAEHGRQGRVTFQLVPGIGHDSAGLTQACQDAFRASVTPAVPDVVGLREHEARAALDEALLNAQIGQRRLSQRPRGEVIAQRPGPATAVPIASTVRLDVSLGRRDPDERHRVPNVIGMSNQDATVALRAEGFTTRLSFADDPRPFGEVVAQQPVGGALALPGSEVHLVASRGQGPL